MCYFDMAVYIKVYTLNLLMLLMVLSIFLHRCSAYNPPTCPYGWQQFSDTCYFFDHTIDQLTFSGAEAACENLLAKLVVIHTQEEQSFLAGHVRTDPNDDWHYYYIGLHDISLEAHFQWIDDSPLDFQAWTPGEPNNGGISGEDCVGLWPQKGGTWNDYPCTKPCAFICEKPLDEFLQGGEPAGEPPREEVPQTAAPQSEVIQLVGRPAEQSSTHNDAVASKAVDGNTNGYYFMGSSCTHTSFVQAGNAWWFVDMGDTYCVGRVVIFNRADCCGDRLSGAVVRIGSDTTKTNNRACGIVTDSMIAQSRKLEVTCALKGRYLSVHLPVAHFLQLCEVRAFTTTGCEEEVSGQQGPCAANEFYCDDPIQPCIPADFRCDTEVDCIFTGNDEKNCPTPLQECKVEFERCQGSAICILPWWRCDGDNDCCDGTNGCSPCEDGDTTCQAGSDEQESYCQSQECGDGLFRCDNMINCIPGHYVCDGDDDCPDGSDEDASTTCNADDFTCPPGVFQCDTGQQCIHQHWVCDTEHDCWDGSDEAPIYEEKNRTCDDVQCPDGYFRCADNIQYSSICIPLHLVCDGQPHCEGAEDEVPPNCYKTPEPCAEWQWQCDNLICIPGSWTCDYEDDCGDSSDEGLGAGCDVTPTCSPTTEFVCDNARCIRKELLCDGNNDCRDFSDEKPQLCATPPPQCRTGEVNCQGECKRPDDCSINPCMLFPSTCSQRCEYEMSTKQYTCSCVNGYKKPPSASAQDSTCLADSTDAATITFCNKFYLRESDILPAEGNGEALARDFSFLVAFDYHFKSQTYYMADVTSKSIWQMDFNGRDRREILKEMPDVEGIAVDWVTLKLYYTDRLLDVVEVSELDGRSRKTLVRQNLFEPRAVAVDPRRGYGHVYWTDWGLNAYIGRVDMDGKNEMELHNKDIVWPNGVTVDYTADKVYWTDAHLDYIAYANLDFTNIHRVLSDDYQHTIAHPFSVDIFEDWMYWTEWNEFKVYKANKRDGSSMQPVLTDLVHRPMDLHVVHPLKQDQSIENPCENQNGGCSHLCLISPSSPSGYICACPDNYEFTDADNRNCEPDCPGNSFLCFSNHRCIPFYWACDGEVDCHGGEDEENCPGHRHCEPKTFQCEHSQSCLHPNLLCDGKTDCRTDDSDERHCADTECQFGEFRCGGGSCIPYTSVCDLTTDCPDGSDEDSEYCPGHECWEGYFKCNNGYCIPDLWWCDLDNDCGDYSDEPTAMCEARSCETGWFSCKTNYRCIPSWAVCYGGDHCRDGSDEGEICQSVTCDPLGEFQCNNGQCVPQRWYCDDERDCTDGSDEPFNCQSRQCSESEFICEDGRCIPGAFQCDGDFDCPSNGDVSDEAGCPERTCDPGAFQCADTGHCISGELRCNGRPNCDDGSDESGCPTRYPGGLYCPEEGFFTCEDTSCIPKWWVCDGSEDCTDGNDESEDNCDLVDMQCNREHSRWRCARSEQCIFEWQRCDNSQDCPDGSDEESCDVDGPCDPETQFACGNGLCIDLNKVCNAQNDCGVNAQDEKFCHNNGGPASGECGRTNGGCQHTCVDTEGGYYCRCDKGFETHPYDPKSCLDIDECVNLPCPQNCYNLKGGFSCECAEGFYDRSESQNGTLCLGDGTELLYISFGTSVGKFSPDGMGGGTGGDIVRNEDMVEGLDFNSKFGLLYYLDRIQRTLKQVTLDHDPSKAPNNLGVDDLYSPQGVAVDYFTGTVYFTDRGEKGRDSSFGRARRGVADTRPKVGAFQATGNLHNWREAVIVAENIDTPSGIAVNPARGFLYWTDLGSSPTGSTGSSSTSTPRVEMSWMNGDQRKKIEYKGFVQPTSLAVDFANNETVFFCDEKTDIIGYFGYDGWNVRILVQAYQMRNLFSPVNPYQMDVFGSNIYFTTKRVDENYVMVVGKDADKYPPQALIRRPVNTLGGIKVYHESLRYPTDIYNPCMDAGCTDMCLLTPRMAENSIYQGFDCVCGRGGGDTQPIEDCDKENPRPRTTEKSTTSDKETSEPAKPPTRAPPPTRPQPPPGCLCRNGGTCVRIGCNCPPDYMGDFCEIANPDKPSGAASSGAAIGAAVGVAFLIILLLIMAVIVLLCYVKKKKRATPPVMYRTGANVEMPAGTMPPPANGEPVYETGLPRTPVTFENPGYGAQAGAEGGDPEKTGLPPDFADVLPEKVDLSTVDSVVAPSNDYTNMPIGPVGAEPPPAYSAVDDLDEKK